MTSALDIITDAYRESNIVGISAALTDAQKAEGLKRLNVLISGALGFEIGEGLEDWPVGAVNVDPQFPNAGPNRWMYPQINSRIILNLNATQTLYFPPNPSDGSRMAVIDVLGNVATYPVVLEGNGRTIEGQTSLLINTNDFNRTWFYRAELGDWAQVAGLLITSPMPFPAEHDDAFTTLLAMRLNPRYGRSMSPESMAWLQRSLNALTARYKQKVVTAADPAVLKMTNIGPGSFWSRRLGGLGIVG